MRIETVEIFVYLLFNLFESLIVYNFFKCFLTLEKKEMRLAVVIYFIRYIILSLIYLNLRNTYINFFINIILFLFLVIPYTNRIKQKIIIVAFYYIMGMAADILLTIFLGFIFEIRMDEVLQPSAVNIIGIVFSKLTLAFFCKFAMRIIQKRQNINLSNWNWIAIIVIPIGSMVLIFFLFAEYENDSVTHFVISLISFLTVINFFIFFVYDKILEDYMIKNDNQLLSQQIAYYNYQLEQIKTSQMAISKIKHDTEKHLLGLGIDLEEGRVEDAKSSIVNLIGSLHLGDGPANSGNVDIDAILNYKSNTAKQSGIAIECDLQLPYDLCLKAADMVVILGNALDNAIEACESVREQIRKIKVEIRYEKRNLHFFISNPYAGSIKQKRDGNYFTTKKDKLFHGLGLRSIRETVDKYDGFMNISANSNVFTLGIILFNIEENTSFSHPATAIVT